MIRKLTIQDYSQVEAIMQQVHALHVGWRPDVYRAVDVVMEEEQYLPAIESGMALGYEEQGCILGIAFFRERKVGNSKQVARRTLFIEDLAVLEEYRGKGIGKKLLEKVQEIAKEQGCDGVELQVNARNQAALEMYRHCGYSEKSINMELNF